MSIGITGLFLKQKHVFPSKTKGEVSFYSLSYNDSICFHINEIGVYGLEVKFSVVRPSSII